MMSEDNSDNEQTTGKLEAIDSWRQNHRIIILIVVSIIISMFLVSVSLSLYNSSGAAQLDLSRPGYSSVREQVKTEEKVVDFPTTGTISQDTLEQFKALYEKKAQSTAAVDAFGGDALLDSQLGIDAPEQLPQ